ncbi:Tyrosinase, partial [Fusarium oxysporum f. sp. albedinis]
MTDGGSRCASAPGAHPMSYTVPWAPLTRPAGCQMFWVASLFRCCLVSTVTNVLRHDLDCWVLQTDKVLVVVLVNTSFLAIDTKSSIK